MLSNNAGVSVKRSAAVNLFLLGSKLGSTGELGRMESPGSKRRYREENYRCKQQLCARNGNRCLIKQQGYGFHLVTERAHFY